MNGRVTSFFNILDLPIPPEYLDTEVTDAEVAARHDYLAAAFARQTEADRAETGDCAVCVCEQGALAGRTVPLYPGKGFPQASEAERAVLGRKPGEGFSARISGELCGLRLERVIRCLPVEVDDELIAGMDLEGISTVSAYDAWFRERESARKKEEKGKALGNYLLRELIERCAFAYDTLAVEAQIEREYVQTQARGQALEEAECRRMVLERLNQTLVLAHLCHMKGVEVTPEDVKGNVDQMMEMYTLMGEPAPNRDLLTEEYIQAEYYTRGMALLLRAARGEAEA